MRMVIVPTKSSAIAEIQSKCRPGKYSQICLQLQFVQQIKNPFRLFEGRAVVISYPVWINKLCIARDYGIPA